LPDTKEREAGNNQGNVEGKCVADQVLMRTVSLYAEGALENAVNHVRQQRPECYQPEIDRVGD
jgi:hypothetical protein